MAYGDHKFFSMEKNQAANQVFHRLWIQVATVRCKIGDLGI